jgi:hypothetical protein
MLFSAGSNFILRAEIVAFYVMILLASGDLWRGVLIINTFSHTEGKNPCSRLAKGKLVG